jgi:hypothetical protein
MTIVYGLWCFYVVYITAHRSMGEKCLATHVEEQKATLAELVDRIHLSPASEGAAADAADDFDHRLSAAGLRIGAVGGELLKGLAGRLKFSGNQGSDQNKSLGARALQGLGQGQGHGQNQSRGGAGTSGSGGSGSGGGVGGLFGLSPKHREVNDEAAAGLVVKHMERLSGQWKGVLQDVVYDRLVSTCVISCVRIIDIFSSFRALYLHVSACSILWRIYC